MANAIQFSGAANGADPSVNIIADTDPNRGLILNFVGTGALTIKGSATTQIVGGTTSISFRNNANTYDNLLILDSGAATLRNGLTVTNGGITLNAGNNLLINGSVSGVVTLKSAPAAGAATFQFPGTNGVSGQVLQTDGTGVTSWFSPTSTQNTWTAAQTFSAHIISGGTAATFAVGSGGGTGSSVGTSAGNDEAGVAAIGIGTSPGTGFTATIVVTFNAPYTGAPKISLTPTNSSTAAIQAYVASTTTGFTIYVNNPAAGGNYSWNYMVIG